MYRLKTEIMKMWVMDFQRLIHTLLTYKLNTKKKCGNCYIEKKGVLFNLPLQNILSINILVLLESNFFLLFSSVSRIICQWP